LRLSLPDLTPHTSVDGVFGKDNDRVHYEGFIGGSGEDGYRINVRGIIKRMRKKFLQCDETFAEIENFVGLGYRLANLTGAG